MEKRIEKLGVSTNGDEYFIARDNWGHRALLVDGAEMEVLDSENLSDETKFMASELDSEDLK